MNESLLSFRTVYVYQQATQIRISGCEIVKNVMVS